MKSIVLAVLVATLAGCAVVPVPVPVPVPFVGFHVHGDGGYYGRGDGGYYGRGGWR